jgi:putative ABC transport system ATP-binding protein
MEFFSHNNQQNAQQTAVRFVDPQAKRKVVEIQDLSVIYNIGKSFESVALQEINLEIYPQEYVVFFGPSGCGKSTLLNIIAGLEIPSKGKVSVENIDIANLSSNDLAKFHQEKISMIFQSYNLIPTLDVLDNVILPQIFQRISATKREARGMELLQKLGIEALQKRLPQELSGGQQQRVSIARALVNNPSIILADEAVGNLDSQSAKNVLDILSLLNTEDQKTIISVTHNPEHLFYADRVFYMKDGRIIKVEVNKKKIKASTNSDYPVQAPDRRRTPLDLLLQAYPDLSSMQLHTMLAPFKAKMLVGYLLSQLETKEITDLEKTITDRLLKKISSEELLHTLDSPAEKGGLGLNKNIATRFSQVVEEIIEKSEFLEEAHKKSGEDSISPIIQTIDKIRHSLLDDYHGELTLDQSEALNRGIEFRILNKISRFEFQEYLDRPLENGGVGLNKKTAKNFSRKVELLMLLEYGK